MDRLNRQPYRIIVEGMDGSGKSTLIQQLEKDFPALEVVHRPVGRTFDDWWPAEMDRSHLRPIPLHDRFFYSELVYGPVLRGKISANMELVNNVAWFLRSTALLIYTRPHSSTISDRIMVKFQMDGVLDHFTELLEAYDTTMMGERTWYGDRFCHYDWNTYEAYSLLLKQVRGYLSGV